MLPLTELKVRAVINTSSGGCDLESEEKMLRILKRAGIVEPSAWCGKATEMERFFSEAAGQKLDVFIVLAGDGTIRRAAEDSNHGGLPYARFRVECLKPDSATLPEAGGTSNIQSSNAKFICPFSLAICPGYPRQTADALASSSWRLIPNKFLFCRGRSMTARLQS